MGIHLDAPVPSEQRVRASPVKNDLISCSWLNLLRVWSLLKTRGDSDGAVVHHYVGKSFQSERNEFHCQITPFTNPFDGLGGYTLHYFEKKEWKVFVFVDVEQLLAMISRMQRSIDDQVISEVAEKRAIYCEKYD